MYILGYGHMEALKLVLGQNILMENLFDLWSKIEVIITFIKKVIKKVIKRTVTFTKGASMCFEQ